MTATLDYRRNFPATQQYWRRRDDILSQFGMLSIWAIVGLGLTGLTFAFGFGTEVMQALAIAG